MAVSISQERRNSEASSIYSRTCAIEELTTTDFSKYMGSGFNISISDLEGKELCPEFVVPGEDMKDIAPVIAKSLREALRIRRVAVMQDLNSIDEVLGLEQKPAIPTD